MNSTPIKLENETAPGVSRYRFRLRGFETHPDACGDQLAFLEACDAPPDVAPWRLVDSCCLPIAAREAWDIEDWQRECQEKTDKARGDCVTLDERDYPPIPHDIEYEVTVRRITPPPGDAP